MKYNIDPNALYTPKRAQELLGFASIQAFMHHIYYKNIERKYIDERVTPGGISKILIRGQGLIDFKDGIKSEKKYT